jgi:phospholipid/cholesterol/gamma-HCH transport system ATP-binding protein
MSVNNNSHAVEFRQVWHSFGENPVLLDINFTVRYGEMKVILGGSGSGKSTILRLALGLIRPDEGEILIDGEGITRLPEDDLFRVRKNMGIVFQKGALFDSLSIRDNVGYRLVEQGWSDDQIDEEVRRQLAFTDFDQDINIMPTDISGGMRRIVAIARAMVGDPRILFFDEPTAGLDPPSARSLCELAAKYRDIRQVASIFVTHRMDDVRFLSSVLYEKDARGQIVAQHRGAGANDFALTNTQFIILRDHRLFFKGTIEEMQQSTDPYIQDFLGEVEFEEEELLVKV